VEPNGRATTVDVLVSSDARFEAHAKSCALARRYRPRLDARGVAIAGITEPFIVKFVR
jgi:hypothetical protein